MNALKLNRIPDAGLIRLGAKVGALIILEAEVGFQPTRTSKPFTRLRRNTVVWKAYADLGWKAPHSRAESNETTIPDNPPRIPALSRHYPVTIWRRRSES